MKSTDKFLAGIVIGALVLVGVVFALALAQPQPAYRADDSPENIAHNYLFALQRGEYARAYSYLSPTLKGYPQSAEVFTDQVKSNRFGFRVEEQIAFAVQPASITGDRADVSAQETRFNRGGLFSANSSVSKFEMRLARDPASGAWKIIKSSQYWNYCWDTGECR